MRGIKFRAQQFDHGKNGFQYGSYVTDNKDYHAIVKESKSSPDEMYNILINPETLGQFTGINDVKGNAIYEGDVVEYLGHGNVTGSNIGVVEYSTRAAKFGVKLLNTQWQGVSKKLRAISSCRLIGNIHSNPELLEK